MESEERLQGLAQLRTSTLARVAAGQQPKRRESTERSKSSNPDIAKRRWIVQQNILVPAAGLCVLFDDASVPCRQA